MDIKAKVTELAGEIGKNPDLLKEFKTSPAATVKKLLKLDVSDEIVNGIVTGVKAKLGTLDAKDAVGGLNKLLGK